MNILWKLFLIGLSITALSIYSVQQGFLDVTDVTNRLFPLGYDPTTVSLVISLSVFNLVVFPLLALEKLSWLTFLSF